MAMLSAFLCRIPFTQIADMNCLASKTKSLINFDLAIFIIGQFMLC
jgi:hypothetical protein